jgi:hypothetical protein
VGNAPLILVTGAAREGTKPMAGEERLAAQLRENLKRRKAQARARKPFGTPEDTQDR